MSKRVYPLLASILGVGLIAGGCGGGPFGSEGFSAQVNGICEHAGEDAARFGERFGGASDPEDAERAAAEWERAATEYFLPHIEGLVADLEDVDPPADRQEEYESLIASFRQLEHMFRRQAEAIREDPDSLFDAGSDIWAEGRTLKKRVEELSEELDVPECTDAVG